MLCFPVIFFSQEKEKNMATYELMLSEKLTELRKLREDSALIVKNEEFKTLLEEALSSDEAFDYPFASLTTVGKIYSDDELVRIFSWNIQYESKLHDYFSFVLKKDERRDKVHLIELKRNKQYLSSIVNETIEHENWYGALYYDIIDVQKGNKTYYTLLGYDANNERSSIKLLDVMYFVGKYPKFGYPIFEVENGFANRVIFEHSARATMSLRYDTERNKIIFDHLSPETPALKEFRDYYIPDMSYDAYFFENNKWRLEEDVIAVNKEKKEEINLRAYDAELDTVVNVPVKSKWINPEDSNAPVAGGGHKAVLPENQTDKEEKIKKSKDKKPDSKGFSGVSYSNLNGKKNKRSKKK